MLNTFFDRFIFTNSLHYKHNNFFLSNVPFVIAPSAMLFGMAKSPDPVFHKHVYYSVKSGVEDYLLKQFEKEFGLKKEKLLEFFQAFFSASGWGLFEFQDINYVEKKAIVFVHNAAFSQFFSVHSPRAVDSFLRGIVSAVFCVIFSENVECVETECSAMGAQHCTFIVKQLHDFDFSNPEVRQQLDIE